VTVIVSIFKQSEKVTDNGLTAFQGLVAGLGDPKFINMAEIGVYVKFALESKDSTCAGLACGIISDLSSVLEGGMNDYLDDFVPCLHAILSD
jgi:hypothetical protein